MQINLLQLFLIVVFSSLAWWVNAEINTIPQLNKIVRVVIVVVAVVLLVSSLFGGIGTHIRIS